MVIVNVVEVGVGVYWGAVDIDIGVWVGVSSGVVEDEEVLDAGVFSVAVKDRRLRR